MCESVYEKIILNKTVDFPTIPARRCFIFEVIGQKGKKYSQ